MPERTPAEDNPPPSPPKTGVVSDLRDLSGSSLADIADSLTDEEAEQTMRRVAPVDGTRLLVAASFNSAI